MGTVYIYGIYLTLFVAVVININIIIRINNPLPPLPPPLFLQDTFIEVFSS
jgi:hypothetical protein